MGEAKSEGKNFWNTVTTSVIASVISSSFFFVLSIYLVRIPHKYQWDLGVERKKIAITLSGNMIRQLEYALEVSETLSNLMEKSKEEYFDRIKYDKDWQNKQMLKLEKLEEQEKQAWIDYHTTKNTMAYYIKHVAIMEEIDKETLEMVRQRSLIWHGYQAMEARNYPDNLKQGLDVSIRENRERVKLIRQKIDRLLKDIDTSLD